MPNVLDFKVQYDRWLKCNEFENKIGLAIRVLPDLEPLKFEGIERESFKTHLLREHL